MQRSAAIGRTCIDVCTALDEKLGNLNVPHANRPVQCAGHVLTTRIRGCAMVKHIAYTFHLAAKARCREQLVGANHHGEIFPASCASVARCALPARLPNAAALVARPAGTQHATVPRTRSRGRWLLAFSTSKYEVIKCTVPVPAWADTKSTQTDTRSHTQSQTDHWLRRTLFPARRLDKSSATASAHSRTTKVDSSASCSPSNH